MRKKHLIQSYSEGDEIKVRYNGETCFHTIKEINEEEVVFEDGSEFCINRKSRNNGELNPPSTSEFTQSISSATVIPEL